MSTTMWDSRYCATSVIAESAIDDRRPATTPADPPPKSIFYSAIEELNMTTRVKYTIWKSWICHQVEEEQVLSPQSLEFLSRVSRGLSLGVIKVNKMSLTDAVV